MSIVSFEVKAMTEYQILFSAHVFKNLNTAPDVNWEELGKALSIEPDLAKNYCENVRKLIKMKVAGNERKEEEKVEIVGDNPSQDGEVVDNNPSHLIVDALAAEQGTVDCSCVQHAETWTASDCNWQDAYDESLKGLKTLEKAAAKAATTKKVTVKKVTAKKAAAKGLVNSNNGVVDTQKLDTVIGE